MNTCCGTHVRNLSQIQMIKFTAKETRKSTMTRVTFLAGSRLSRAVSEWSVRERQLNDSLHTQPSQHVTTTVRMAADIKAFSQQQRSLMKELAGFIARDLFASVGGSSENSAEQQQQPLRFIEYHREDADLGFLQTVASAILELETPPSTTPTTTTTTTTTITTATPTPSGKAKGKANKSNASAAPSTAADVSRLVLFLTCGSGSSEANLQFLIVGPRAFVQQHSAAVAATVGQKGGGRPGTYQGKFPAAAAGAAMALRQQVASLLNSFIH
eukprot:TRINITY_DN6495_c0_g1_i2.p1 TRINITY_DN6495_c0_g1~~TRINITY_DN6495_c0_g1_i2.p1  ORF type:complete len:271 (-),score=76.76 TRINITY_DN6495_c0_g1_i2:35-847(-)